MTDFLECTADIFMYIFMDRYMCMYLFMYMGGGGWGRELADMLMSRSMSLADAVGNVFSQSARASKSECFVGTFLYQTYVAMWGCVRFRNRCSSLCHPFATRNG